MKRFIIVLIFIPILSFSQNNIERQLDSINSSEDALSFIKKSKYDGQVFTFNKEKHKTRLADDLFKLSKGSKKVIRTNYNKTYYKVLDKSEITYYRFDIIVIDAAKTSDFAAKAIRAKILSQYNEGYRFKDLAKHHSTGPTAKMGGDTGWIKPGDISSAFDEAAFNENRELNTIFSIDDIENKKFYLAIKTKDRTPIEEITVLKFTEEAK